MKWGGSLNTYYAPPQEGALSDTAIRLSVCLSHGAAAMAIGTLAGLGWIHYSKTTKI